jgi:hypothetical protein
MRADFSSQNYFRNPPAEIEKLRLVGPVVEVQFPIVGKIWTTTTQELADRVKAFAFAFTVVSVLFAVLLSLSTGTLKARDADLASFTFAAAQPALLARADEVIEYSVSHHSFAAAHESGCGTCATCRDEAFRSAFGGKPDIEPTSPNDESDRQPVFGSIHATCLKALVTDPAMEAWYHPSTA